MAAEYRILAVVGVAGAMQQIKSSQRITVGSTTGTVVLPHEAAEED